MKRFAMFALAAVTAGCSIGAPPGFSGGGSWTIPLVGPLEDGLLIIPVFIHDKGPYLMAIDPDSPISAVDQAIVSELDLRSGLGPRVLDETDTNRPIMLAEVLRFQFGPALTVRSRQVAVMKVGSFSAGGRQLRGVIGRDVIADSLVFGFDRDLGVAYLATQKGFTPPAGAAAVMGYDVITNRLAVEMQPVSRKVSTVQIDGKNFKLHLDLGAVASQLRGGLWQKAGLTAIPIQTEARDEAGTVRRLDQGAVGGQVTSGAVSAGGVLFIPYGDKRWEEEFIDGTLGLNFFRMFSVWANWDQEKFYLVPRGDAVATAKARIGRWQSAVLDGCVQLGCVTLDVIEPPPAPPPTTPPAPVPSGGGAPGASGAPGAGAPPAMMTKIPRSVLVVTRDPAAAALDLEIMLGAVGENGEVTNLPRLVINLPVGTDSLSSQLDPSYTGTKPVILDISPYPRPCNRQGGCIQALAATIH